MDFDDIEELAYQCLLAEFADAAVLEGRPNKDDSFKEKRRSRSGMPTENRWHGRELTVIKDSKEKVIYVTGKQYAYLQASMIYRHACHRGRMKPEYVRTYDKRDYE